MLSPPSLATAAVAAPAAVNLRVEGASSTTFEDRITTDGHNVTTAAGGTHKCDGTNGGRQPDARPDRDRRARRRRAARRLHLGRHGTTGFDDYLVDRVGPDSQTSTQFWGLLVELPVLETWAAASSECATGDEVLWAFDGFSKATRSI